MRTEGSSSKKKKRKGQQNMKFKITNPYPTKRYLYAMCLSHQSSYCYNTNEWILDFELRSNYHRYEHLSIASYCICRSLKAFRRRLRYWPKNMKFVLIHRTFKIENERYGLGKGLI